MLFKKSLQLFLMLLLPTLMFAQVTTSSITGKITDASGKGLEGANVVATHEPSGTSYKTISRGGGLFDLPELRVGGPYTLRIEYVGYNSQLIEAIQLELGVPYDVTIDMSEAASEAGKEVVVTSVRSGASVKTGASTTIGIKQLNTMPSINRSLQDFTRLTPQANGNSFVGTNNRFNNITIDGAVNNDVFGLSGSGTPGGSANTQPISLDAIQEIQVVLAPYNVTNGNFTGGGVNAITKSGTNTLRGSAYMFGRNQNTVGKNVLTGDKNADFSNYQYGLSLGGPIIKNKLFFFANAEFQRITAPLSNNAGETGAAISEATAKKIAEYTMNTYGYDVGGYGPINAKTQNNKIFAKIDWNIHDNHQLAVRYNHINAFDDNISRSSSFFRFGNNAYKFNNNQNVLVGELRSRFRNNLSNNLIIGYTRIRDNRQVAGALFPQVTILNLEGVSGNSAELGSQRSSVANRLDQDIFEFTDNLNLFIGKHKITLGTHNEFFRFANLFINNFNGRWDFNSVDDFIDNKPARVRATYSRIEGTPRPEATFSAAQLAFYTQDEYSPSDFVKLTLGLRVDIPVFGSKPLANDSVAKYFPGYQTNRTFKSTPLFSPRFGFNWDLNKDKGIVARGGTGIFTGRVPFVWLSNQFSNDGMKFGTVDQRNPQTFIKDIDKQREAGAGSNRAEINLVENNFKIPQVWRSNLAFDFEIEKGWRITLEGIYSKTLNNIVYSDISRKENGSIDAALSNGADKRTLWTGRISPANFTNVVLLGNSNKGYTYSLTAQLQKAFDFGLNGMFAYTFGQARSVNDGASSTALSNWEFVQVVNNPNNPDLAISNYELRHRFVGNLNYGIKYGKDNLFGTSISIFYSGNSGSPYTYLYNGDLNGDGQFNNDLFFVPAKREDIKLLPFYQTNPITRQREVVPNSPTPEQQWTALESFINNDPYLRSRKGEYAERNGARTPWEHHFDLRIAQDLGIRIGQNKNVLQLTFDIFNVGNLLNKNWGRSYYVTNQANTIVTYSSNDGRGYNFRAPTDNLGYQTSPFGSAWSGQFGIRYIFN